MTSSRLVRLLDEGRCVPLEEWTAFWTRVEDRAGDPGELVAVLTAASRALPRDETLVALVRSLAPAAVPAPVPAVDIVGIGGGPSTMNLSTAAAFAAAAAGASVLKSGSRAYTSSLGSTDLLGRLGLRADADAEQGERYRRRDGLAFPGRHAHPVELVRLARRIVPVGLREFGGLLNVIGPFLSRTPVSAVVVGRSDRAGERTLRALAGARPERSHWICSSAVGADELISVSPSRLVRPDGRVERIEPGSLVSGSGSMAELRAVAPEAAAEHFSRALSGRLGTAVTETITLNAAVVLLAGGVESELPAAVDRVRSGLESGAAAGLLERLRSEAREGAALHA
ncbi:MULTISPECIES: hypothetical protein [unclassified Rathayibacter]|uniref:hypothetical protein n=1 Tax=unclassified Rathayibacter TaxID=2609250 RepID=UPI001889D520|nr:MULTISPECIES: hypothetical protein [unclassified Rathayibacter]MBF4463174.1 hypothetical protein [Rathayibacter sp. VKM Ac-2879]MBF4504589.1 hypothetical protein [Rathayibacter sp. VKM Ac-2878]